jgi:hypothetical protein
MEQMESRTAKRLATGGLENEESNIPFEMVSAGLHWSRRMSRQMLPFALMLGW